MSSEVKGIEMIQFECKTFHQTYAEQVQSERGCNMYALHHVKVK